MTVIKRTSQTLATVLLAATLALVAGCSGDVEKNGPSNPGYDPNGEPINNPDPSYTPPPAPTCGGQSIPIVLKHNDEIPDLYLVVDKSGSMTSPVDLFDFANLLRTKWLVMQETLSALVETFQGKVRFGISLYPADNSCQAAGIDVPMQMGNEAQIKQLLNSAGADGWTPTHTSLAAVRGYLRGVPRGTGPRYVLLATDGIPNCGVEQETQTDAESIAEVQALVAEDVKVFVVGFGDIVFSNPATLDQMADAGGRPNPNGPHRFYPATSAEELKDALFTIAAGIIPPPCTYELTSQPDDPDLVTVKFNGDPVPRTLSNTMGWNYSESGREIKFFGEACDRLRGGQVSQVEFVFGCKGPVIN